HPKLGIFLLAVLGILIGTWALHKLGRSPFIPVPPSTHHFESRYRNVQPQVRYVGDEACVGCHREMAQTYCKHPMAHSLEPVAQADAVERYDVDAHNPFGALGFRYEIKRLDQRMFHTEKRINSKGEVAAELQAEVKYALGSGTRGRSYLVEHDGFLFQ